jgi:CRP-like cAMP-binding protein
MLAAGTRRDLPKGSILIRQDEPIGEVYLLLEGLLSVRTAKTGEADIARLRPGEIVGEMSFIDSRPPSASVAAIEPSRVLAIPRQAFEARLRADAPFAARFYRALAVFLSNRLRSTVSLLGYGRIEPDAEAEDEIGPETLDRLSVAGARFDWLQRRIKAT